MDRISLMEKYFIDVLPEKLDDSSEYPIFLVAIGEKKGAVTMNADEDQVELLKMLCQDLGLHYEIGEGRKSKPSKAVGENKNLDQRGFFISNKKKHLEVLEDGRFYGFSDRSVGKFLGFPDKAIEFFEAHEQPAMVSRKKIAEMREDGSFGEELKYLNLVTYIPPPEAECVEKGIEKGREREELMERYDGENGTDIGKKYLEKRFSRNLYR